MAWGKRQGWAGVGDEAPPTSAPPTTSAHPATSAPPARSADLARGVPFLDRVARALSPDLPSLGEEDDANDDANDREPNVPPAPWASLRGALDHRRARDPPPPAAKRRRRAGGDDRDRSAPASDDHDPVSDFERWRRILREERGGAARIPREAPPRKETPHRAIGPVVAATGLNPKAPASSPLTPRRRLSPPSSSLTWDHHVAFAQFPPARRRGVAELPRGLSPGMLAKLYRSVEAEQRRFLEHVLERVEADPEARAAHREVGPPRVARAERREREADVRAALERLFGYRRRDDEEGDFFEGDHDHEGPRKSPKVSEGRACAFRLHVDPGAGLPRGVVSLAADATATERLRLDVVREDANPRDPADGPAPLAVDELMTSAAARSVDPGDGDEDSDGDSGDARGGSELLREARARARDAACAARVPHSENGVGAPTTAMTSRAFAAVAACDPESKYGGAWDIPLVVEEEQGSLSSHPPRRLVRFLDPLPPRDLTSATARQRAATHYEREALRRALASRPPTRSDRDQDRDPPPSSFSHPATRTFRLGARTLVVESPLTIAAWDPTRSRAFPAFELRCSVDFRARREMVCRRSNASVAEDASSAPREAADARAAAEWWATATTAPSARGVVVLRVAAADGAPLDDAANAEGGAFGGGAVEIVSADDAARVAADAGPRPADARARVPRNMGGAAGGGHGDARGGVPGDGDGPGTRPGAAPPGTGTPAELEDEEEDDAAAFAGGDALEPWFRPAFDPARAIATLAAALEGVANLPVGTYLLSRRVGKDAAEVYRFLPGSEGDEGDANPGRSANGARDSPEDPRSIPSPLPAPFSTRDVDPAATFDLAAAFDDAERTSRDAEAGTFARGRERGRDGDGDGDGDGDDAGTGTREELHPVAPDALPAAPPAAVSAARTIPRTFTPRGEPPQIGARKARKMWTSLLAVPDEEEEGRGEEGGEGEGSGREDGIGPRVDENAAQDDSRSRGRGGARRGAYASVARRTGARETRQGGWTRARE